MSERFKQLAARLESLPALSTPDFLLRAAAQAVLTTVSKSEEDLAVKRRLLEASMESIDSLARRVGDGNEHVKILRGMHAIVMANVEGREEPTDETLGLAQPSRRAQSSGKCFIATAACGTEQVPDVVRLRQFRDVFLKPTTYGRSLVKVYEFVSPPVAELIGRSEFARAAVRKVIVRPARWGADLMLNLRHNDDVPCQETQKQKGISASGLT